MAEPKEVPKDILIKLLCTSFDQEYNAAVNKFVADMKSYFEKNRAEIIKKNIINIYNHVDPTNFNRNVGVILKDL